MARYIDADALLEELDLIEMNTQSSIKQGDKNYKLYQKGILLGLNWCRNIIYEIPTADVAEVRHGKWVHTDYAMHWLGKDECSECTYHTSDRDDLSHFNFCPNCGAKMDKGVIA